MFSLFETSTPQLYLDIDRTKAQMLGINVSDVFGALQTYLGSTYVNDFNLLGRTFRVTAQADARLPARHQGRAQDPRAQQPRRYRAARLVHHRARHLGALSACRATTSIRRPSSTPPPCPATRRARRSRRMEKLAAETLPEGISYEWTTLAFQQLRAGSTAIFAFMLAVVFVFLVLAAQYESLTLPLAVILIVPMCLVAAITGVILRGQDNNILTQVGLHRADRAGGQERHPDRRVRQAAGGPGPRPLGGRGRGRAAAAAADPDDLARVHPRRGAAGVGRSAPAPSCARRWAPPCSPA